jgi:uncharacterized protein (DUF4415 family)
MKARKPLTDEEGEVRELLLEDIKRFRPMGEGLSPSLAAKLGLQSRRKQKPPPKERVTIPLSRDVLDKFRATGKGWETRLDAALREWVDTHLLS